MVPGAEEMPDTELAEQIEAVRRRLQEQMADARQGVGADVSAASPAAGGEGVTAATGAGAPPPVGPSDVPARASRTAPAPELAPGAERRVAIGADHGGYQLKCVLVELLQELGLEPYDVGTDSTGSVDYPDFALKVARAVARGEAHRGIMIDGAGIGSAMAANKVLGVRAATCHNETTVVNSREHNNANVLVLGSGQVNRGLAQRMVRIWLRTPFGGGRHQRRVDKIDALDRG